jgi:hypothetical protein
VDSRYTNNTKSNSSKLRFNTLLSLGQFVSFFGWVVVIASVIFILYGIDSIKSLGFITIVGGVISLVNGILVVCIGQLISCFVSIESNTQRTNSLLEELIKK